MTDLLNEDPDIYITLRALVEQIAMAEFRDELGHPLRLNKAYRDALALVKLREGK